MTFPRKPYEHFSRRSFIASIFRQRRVIDLSESTALWLCITTICAYGMHAASDAAAETGAFRCYRKLRVSRQPQPCCSALLNTRQLISPVLEGEIKILGYTETETISNFRSVIDDRIFAVIFSSLFKRVQRSLKFGELMLSDTSWQLFKNTIDGL